MSTEWKPIFSFSNPLHEPVADVSVENSSTLLLINIYWKV